MKRDMKYILAIDLGTSGAKVALVSIYGEVVGWEYEPVALHLVPGGGAEQDPEDWWHAISAAVKRLTNQRLVSPQDIDAVCTSAMGEETVAVDREGRSLMRCINWMDSRGAKHIKKLITGPFRVAGYDIFKLIRWVRITGGGPSKSGKDPAGHMQYIRYERPDVYEKTYKFLNSLDFVNLRLTGELVSTYDSIMTSWVTDTRDPDNITYHDGLVRASGIDRERYPELVKSTEIIGTLRPEVVDEWGLSPKVKVVAGAIDVSASAIGSGAVEDYQTIFYLGTSSYLSAHVPFKKTDVLHGMASLPCAIPGKYLLMNNQTTAGGSLNFLRDKILYHKDALLREEHKPDVFKVFDEACKRVPAGSNGLIYTPWIYGERTPVDDHLLRGGIHNISLENTREDIIRAVFEGVAFNTRWMLGPAEKFISRKMDPISMVGGGATSDIWCQIHADVLERTISQLKNPIQVNARGAGLIASVALGYIDFKDILGLTEFKDVYDPRPSVRTLYDDLFQTFLRLYKKNRGIYHRLNRTDQGRCKDI